MRLLLFLVLVLSLSHISAQNLLINNSNGDLLSFDINGCATSVLTDIGSFTDIAAHPNGFVYGINSNGQISKIDPVSGGASFQISFPGNSYYALTSDANGTIFGASGNGGLASYNPDSGELINYPNMGFEASGDLTFYQGQMYMATTDNTIVSVHPETPENNEVFIDFSSTNATIFGIVSAVEGCDVVTYAISNDNQAKVYEIDWLNQSFSLVCTIPHQIYGGSSTFEFNASTSVFETIISTSNTGCEVPETLVEIDATSPNGGVLFSLDGENFQSENTFQNLDFGTYTLYLEDAGGCEGTSSFTLEAGELDADFTTTATTCENDNGTISIAASTNATTISYSIDGENFQENNVFENLQAADYQIIVQTDNGCELNETISIEALPIGVIEEISTSPTACNLQNGRIEIQASSNDLNFSLDGENFTNSTIFEHLAAGNYTIFTQDENACTTSMEAIIAESEQSCDLYIPNIFSPNFDGNNDYFRIYSETDYAVQKMQIFSRWGELIFEATDFSSLDQMIRWDGTFRGKEMTEGVFVYQVIYATNGTLNTLSGSITLTR